MSEATEKANALRFKILTTLGAGGADLLRDFEIALNEERPTLVPLDEYQFTDKRALEIAKVEHRIGVLATVLHGAKSSDIDAITASLTDALAAKEEAHSLPEHEYECCTCKGEGEAFESFQSPARMVLILSGYVDHDENGQVSVARKFRKPLHMILCPDCKSDVRLEDYFKRWN